MKIIRTKEIESILPIKISVSKARWKEIQIRLFSLGCKWSYSGKSIIETYEPYLFVDKNKYIRCSTDKDIFNKHENALIKEEDIL